jgi:hypothetical protein
MHVCAHALGGVAFAAGKEIVDADEICAALQQSLAQVEAKRPAGQQGAFSRGATRRRLTHDRRKPDKSWVLAAAGQRVGSRATRCHRFGRRSGKDGRSRGLETRSTNTGSACSLLARRDDLTRVPSLHHVVWWSKVLNGFAVDRQNCVFRT